MMTDTAKSPPDDRPRNPADTPREKADDGPSDAAEALGTKRRKGEHDRDEAAPGAVAPDELSSETDDGAG